MATNLIDVQSERDAAEPVAPAPATPLPDVPSGVQVTSALKITAKVGAALFETLCWFNPIQFTVAGDHVTVTGAYRPRDVWRRLYWWIGFMLTALAATVLGGLLIDRSAEQSTGADIGVAIVIGGLILVFAAAARMSVVSLRETRKAKQTPRTHVFPRSAVTFVELERFGSPVLLGFLLIFGGILPGYLVWRFLFNRMRGLRITAPFDPEKPSEPETYRLAAKTKEEAAALAQALLVSGASPANRQ